MQKRARCSDEKFIESVLSSRTYAEVAEKTGQKITSTIARYARVKSALAKKGISLPTMERSKTKKTFDNLEYVVATAKKLKDIYET